MEAFFLSKVKTWQLRPTTPRCLPLPPPPYPRLSPGGSPCQMFVVPPSWPNLKTYCCQEVARRRGNIRPQSVLMGLGLGTAPLNRNPAGLRRNLAAVTPAISGSRAQMSVQKHGSPAQGVWTRMSPAVGV